MPNTVESDFWLANLFLLIMQKKKILWIQLSGMLTNET